MAYKSPGADVYTVLTYIHINIFCALQLAYFKAKKIFYKISWDLIPTGDLDFIINTYFFGQNIILNPVSKYHCYKQQKLITHLTQKYYFAVKLPIHS